MFIMKGALILFISLAIGYVICILAKKQDGILKTVGYTIGIAILTLSLLYGVAESVAQSSMTGMSMNGCKGMKCHPGLNMIRAHHK
jgi:hypothetical protein